MKRTIQILAVLFVAQLLLAVALFLPGTPLGRSASAGGPLVEFDPAAIDRITIEGPEDARVALARRDGAWQVDGDTMFPADARRVEELLDRLAKLQAGDVVATSASAHERFKVADESFERRVTLASGERTVATLYGGTSPALRRLHVRAGGEDEVRIAELAAYDIPVQGKDWRDTSVLAIPEDEIAAIEVADLRIERAPRSEGDEDEGKDGDTGGAGPAWIVAGGDTREPVNKEVADKLARALADLRFDDVLGTEAKPEYGLENPLLRLGVERRDGQRVEYLLGKAPEQEEYTLKVSTRPEHFRLAGWRSRSLVEAASRDALLGSGDDGKEDEPSDSPSGEGEGKDSEAADESGTTGD